jgi:hypothetical protein
MNENGQLETEILVIMSVLTIVTQYSVLWMRLNSYTMRYFLAIWHRMKRNGQSEIKILDILGVLSCNNPIFKFIGYITCAKRKFSPIFDMKWRKVVSRNLFAWLIVMLYNSALVSDWFTLWLYWNTYQLYLLKKWLPNAWNSARATLSMVVLARAQRNNNCWFARDFFSFLSI